MSVLDFSNMFKGNSGKETDLNALLFDDVEPTHTLTSDVPTDVSQHSMDWIYRELELLNIVTPVSLYKGVCRVGSSQKLVRVETVNQV